MIFFPSWWEYVLGFPHPSQDQKKFLPKLFLMLFHPLMLNLLSMPALSPVSPWEKLDLYEENNTKTKQMYCQCYSNLNEEREANHLFLYLLYFQYSLTEIYLWSMHILFKRILTKKQICYNHLN